MKTPKKEIIDEIFQGLDLDYSEFKESAEMAIFIASFIAVNVKKGISLDLVHHSWSGHHSLSVSGKKTFLLPSVVKWVSMTLKTFMMKTS